MATASPWRPTVDDDVEPRRAAVTLSERIAQRVRMLRRQHGMNREQLASACQQLGGPASLSAAAITNIETGRPTKDGGRRRAVTVDELGLFAAVFSVTPADLLSPDTCGSCGGAPPRGFTCNECGISQPRRDASRATPATALALSGDDHQHRPGYRDEWRPE
jgi:transcriptional regulator with XRE-family HTH domain